MLIYFCKHDTSASQLNAMCYDNKAKVELIYGAFYMKLWDASMRYFMCGVLIFWTLNSDAWLIQFFFFLLVFLAMGFDKHIMFDESSQKKNQRLYGNLNRAKSRALLFIYTLFIRI